MGAKLVAVGVGITQYSWRNNITFNNEKTEDQTTTVRVSSVCWTWYRRTTTCAREYREVLSTGEDGYVLNEYGTVQHVCCRSNEKWL